MTEKVSYLLAGGEKGKFFHYSFLPAKGVKITLVLLLMAPKIGVIFSSLWWWGCMLMALTSAWKKGSKLLCLVAISENRAILSMREVFVKSRYAQKSRALNALDFNINISFEFQIALGVKDNLGRGQLLFYYPARLWHLLLAQD